MQYQVEERSVGVGIDFSPGFSSDGGVVLPPPLPLAALHAMSLLEFTRALLPIYAEAPWVPALAFAQRPFLSLDHLHRALADVLISADLETKEQVIALHPDFLAPGSEATAAERAAASRLIDNEPMHPALRHLQADYEKKFGFPLVICLEEAPPSTLAESLTSRLENMREQEITNAIDELSRTARRRIAERFVA